MKLKYLIIFTGILSDKLKFRDKSIVESKFNGIKKLIQFFELDWGLKKNLLEWLYT